MFEGLKVIEHWPLMGELGHKEKNRNEVITFHIYPGDVLSAMGWAGEGDPEPLALGVDILTSMGIMTRQTKMCLQLHFHKLTEITFRNSSAT